MRRWLFLRTDSTFVSPNLNGDIYALDTEFALSRLCREFVWEIFFGLYFWSWKRLLKSRDPLYTNTETCAAEEGEVIEELTSYNPNSKAD